MAQKNYDELSQSILDNIGGKDNIKSLAHCITRLRFKLKDVSKANTEAIEALPGVIKVLDANGQYHVVVGNKVEEVYDSFLKVSGLHGGGEVAADDDDSNEKKTPAAVLIDLISGIFAPMLGTFAAAGIMKGLLAPRRSSSLSSLPMAPIRCSTRSPTACSTSFLLCLLTTPLRSSA